MWLTYYPNYGRRGSYFASYSLETAEQPSEATLGSYKCIEISPALTVLETTWKHIPPARSERDAGHMMYHVLREVVGAGILFGIQDAEFIDRRYSPFGADGIESFYSAACGVSHGHVSHGHRANLSAARSVESWLGRQPHLYYEAPGRWRKPPKKLTPRRLAVGTQFYWPPFGKDIDVTSFAGDHLNAVFYRHWQTDAALMCARDIGNEHLGKLYRQAGRDAEVNLEDFRSWEPSAGHDPAEILGMIRSLHITDGTSYRRVVSRRFKLTPSDLRLVTHDHALAEAERLRDAE